MSPRIAWAFIALLSGEPATDISDRELARLATKYRMLLAAQSPAVLLRSWLRRRAQPLRLAVSLSDVEALLEDPRLVPSGISDARSEMSAGREAEACVRPGDVILDVRAQPSVLCDFTGALAAVGFTSAGVSPEGHRHRWVRDKPSIDVLIPRGLGVC
ncbi:MAG: hypothetical protein ACP5P1_12795 [Acidimicrobiales bacterium]